jgi:UDP-3-O-[3-hydroxymyristoyl] glucosamine N-acyltransferase
MIKLSILKNTTSGFITYYVGDDINHLSHLKNCILYCKRKFELNNSVEQIIVDNPQLEFYKISNLIENQYLFDNPNKYKIGNGCNIHRTVVIGNDVVIGNNVTIGPNTVIYSKTIIGDGSRIDANCTIGAEGMMWVWDEYGQKIFLRQLGGVIIGKNCIIGSNVSIVRGSANENTIINDDVNMAPGCNIGHGTFIGKNTHLANNVSTGGSSYIESNVFLGCSSIVNPSTRIDAEDVIIASGAVVSKTITESGVYGGIPAKFLKNIQTKLKGVPHWR